MPYFNMHKRLTTSQFEIIVNRRKPKRLIRLNLRNLSDVDPKILAKSLLDEKFVEVNLKETNLTKTQLETIFTQAAIIPEGRPMMMLDLSHNNLSQVHPKIMSRAVVKIEQVDLNDTFLSMEQAEVLFKEILENEDICLSHMTVDKHICQGKNKILAKDVAKKIELDTVEARSEELRKLFKEQGMGAITFAIMNRGGDEEEEEAELDNGQHSDWTDYVFDEDDDAICKADYQRSESEYRKKYSRILAEEEIKKRGIM